LQKLHRTGESDRVEFMETIKDRDEIKRHICAFSNDLPNHNLPGVLFIGIRDDGTFTKSRFSDLDVATLSNFKDDGNILPLPSIEVEKIILPEGEPIAVIVHPSLMTPIRYRGRTYIRVGSTTRLASPDEEIRLSEKRRYRDLSFDLRPLTSATIKDLDLDLFKREYLPFAVSAEELERNQRGVEQQLVALRFLTPDNLPTALGILTAGKSPRDFIPGAYIQFLRIEGIKTTDPIKDQKEIGGSIIQVLRILDETLKINISVATELTSGTVEIKHPDYPIDALQQLARNAVLHRQYEGTNTPVRISWFSEHIEILSPGGPYGKVTAANFGKPGYTDYRNPGLAEVIKNLGYIQRFGLGFEIARKKLEENINPPFEVSIEDNFILITIRKRK